MKEEVRKYLEELVKEGVIKEYYLDKFNYWNGVPFIKLNNGNKVALAKTQYIRRSLVIKTIWEYKNSTYMKEKIKNTIKMDILSKEVRNMDNDLIYKQLEKEYNTYKNLRNAVEKQKSISK